MADGETVARPEGDAPVTVALCEERSKRIEEKVDSGIKSVHDALTKLDKSLEAVVESHAARLYDHKSTLDKHSQLLADKAVNRDNAYKKGMLYVAIVAVVITLLSNLDKIAAAFK